MKKSISLLLVITLFFVLILSSPTSAEFIEVDWMALETAPNFTVYNSANNSVDHNSWRSYPHHQIHSDPDEGTDYAIDYTELPHVGPDLFPGTDFGTLYSWDRSNIETFDIYLKGYNYDADGDDIDIFVSFLNRQPNSGDTLGTDYFRLTGSNTYTLPEGLFQVTYDLVNKSYNYGSGDIPIVYSDPSFDPLALFQNQDDFWIGYGCHFKMWKTKITVDGSGTYVIPEPATMFLFGSGLIGLAGLGRKRYFKKS